MLETTHGLLVGTPAYLAPEQLRGERPDARTDLHAMGVCLYEMLAGRRPWTGRTHAELSAKILRDEAPPLQEIAPAIDLALATVIHRALAKDPDDRFRTAEQMCRALERPEEAVAPAAELPSVMVSDAPDPRATTPSLRSRAPQPVVPRERSGPPRGMRVISGSLVLAACALLVVMASTGALSRRAGATVQAAEPEPAPTPMPMPVTAPPSASVVSPTVEPLWTEDPAEDRPTAPPKPPPAKPRTDASSTPSGVFPAVKRFSEVEVAHGIAWSPLSGGDFIGDHCYCLPRDDLRAQRATTNLQCARCANVSVAA
jgi:serine/threonine-protein kinase